MEVGFRADASVDIGTGHVMRCITLANALTAQGANCRFYMRDLAGSMAQEVRSNGHAVSVLPGLSTADAVLGDLAHSDWLGTSWQIDAAQTLGMSDGAPHLDWLVVDHYALDHRWHKQLRARASRILVIDDLADRQLDCDVLLDQNTQITEGRYDRLAPANCLQLLGPRYALLRPEFGRERCRVVRRAEASVKRIFLFFGGSDLPGLTLLSLEALSTVVDAEGIEIDVLVGDANPDQARIAQWCSDRPQAHYRKRGADVCELMARADIALGAGGTTTWERCCLGLPSIVVAIAENQLEGARAVADAGACDYVGDWRTIDRAQIVSAVDRLMRDPQRRASISEHGMALTDGRGADLVAMALKQGG